MKVLKLYKQHGTNRTRGQFSVDGIIKTLDCTFKTTGKQTYEVLVRIKDKTKKIIAHMAVVSCVIIVGPLP